MIQTEHLTKNFGKLNAVQDITSTIKKGSIFGLIGSNGAGKSTYLRMLAGIYRPDGGTVRIDGEEVYENAALKQRVIYISDDQYDFANGTMQMMANYYATVYNRFDMDMFHTLTERFQLDPNRKLNTFSKGMRKQAHIILALSCRPDYLLCDETFDGLDPVMRQAVKRLLADEVLERQMTPIIASHNLRELEDICDHIGLLHKGGVVFERELDDLRLNIHKVQCAFAEKKEKEAFIEAGLELVTCEQRGNLSVLVVRGDSEKTEEIVKNMHPLYMELIPLTLEEIFITEMEALGYDIQQLIY